MCIIIDTNVLNEVFDDTNKYHEDFIHVYNWIFSGKGKIVYGGTKYQGEIGKYLQLFNLLKQANKAIYIEQAEVDREQDIVSQMVSHQNFDDQHIVALLRVSGCKLICSNDSRAYPFFTHKVFFKSSKKPKIYSSKKNKILLSEKNIAECCKPACKISNKVLKELGLA